ncbi:hypothetical protein JVU11DRAFT_6099 [Chiua virens]|nr:hypothetical protein JVU11DRAFT_6099 [Chiua virens]
MSNPIRFGQEFQGRIANPRDVLIFHRAKKTARSAKVTIDEPELSIDDPELSISEKLSKIRVHTLVKEYLAAQELQLLGEAGMSDAIQMFVEKDDSHAISSHVSTALRTLMKGVQANGELDEADLDDVVTKVREQHEQDYAEQAKPGQAREIQGKARADELDAGSDDSMMMDVDMAGSDFEEQSDEAPPPKKKATVSKKTTASKKAPAKKTPAKGRGKKTVASESEEVIELDVDEDEAEEPIPFPTKKTNRAMVSSQTAAKKAPAQKTTASRARGGTQQSTLSFAPSGRSSARAAATRAKSKLASTVDSDD